MDTLCWKRGRVGSKGTHAQEEACPVPHAAHGVDSACVSAEEMHVGCLSAVCTLLLLALLCWRGVCLYGREAAVLHRQKCSISTHCRRERKKEHVCAVVMCCAGVCV